MTSGNLTRMLSFCLTALFKKKKQIVILIDIADWL